MSERILKALMQLFAIIARVDEEIDSTKPVTSGAGRTIVEAFLKQELGSAAVQEYLNLFDEFLISHQGASGKKDGQRKKTSVHSVKVLRICTQINEELAQRQKIIVLVRILEFINANDVVAEQEQEFAQTVADTFNVDMDEYNRIRSFVELPLTKREDDPNWLYVSSTKTENFQQAKHIFSEGIEGEIRVLKIPSVNFYFFKYLGNSDLSLNGQPLMPGRHIILNQGSSIRSSRVQPIYYSDIIAKFLSDQAQTKIVFKTDNIEYMFKGGKIGLHKFNFAEESGSLLGIMGGSGAGKSTLLNILNGNYPPTSGKVTINGVDIHRSKTQIEGVIGYVSQDDLLIEELTVFQNLFYNAKLCFGGLSDKQIAKKVLRTLSALGLYETKDLKVGSPLEKTISGGQRKRLNIGLELIREPSVMFVDEPTSGLSSRDSENIMDLLKELALKGKLIFVVIHQPSSDIFKMFDKLLILDQGGYPIYNGNPVDAIMYFKKRINHVKSDESECHTCGNVNPEQIFNIIESKVVDEYGNQTQHRKVSPKEWNSHYLDLLEKPISTISDVHEIPESTFKKPGFFKQLGIYFIRDVLSKLTNTQYVLINLLEAPALAFILAFFVKFYNLESGTEYIFNANQNIPQFLFIAVIVALFIGLTVAAEEIIKDQKILKRESFLNLSKGSYLMSKISIMFLISAIQMLLFVAVGNWILEINGMWFSYWLILFSLSCFANLLGLNISASFNSVKVIYILIPILIIPQLLFSGVIVKFDKLNPLFGDESSVPLIGNVMASRWAYEGMAVTTFKDNAYSKHFYNYEKKKSFATWKKDYWLQDLSTRLDYLKTNNQETDSLSLAECEKAYTILSNEIRREENYIQNVKCEGCADAFEAKKFDESVIDKTTDYFNILKKHYKSLVDSNRVYIDRETQKIIKEQGEEAYHKLVDENTNESLTQFATNKTDLTKLVEDDGFLIQKSDPIYLDPYDKGFFAAHFYAPQKRFFGMYVDTFTANVLVIWFMSILLTITLYYDILKKMLDGMEKLFSKIKFRKKAA
ncbi:MAG: ATP-binding cassette domain-containing protein [Crocinitomicaceae bacterium]|nr:ATP-binding cassette domain-containing protein [Crocinitomicaceae bacterium]